MKHISSHHQRSAFKVIWTSVGWYGAKSTAKTFGCCICADLKTIWSRHAFVQQGDYRRFLHPLFASRNEHQFLFRTVGQWASISSSLKWSLSVRRNHKCLTFGFGHKQGNAEVEWSSPFQNIFPSAGQPSQKHVESLRILHDSSSRDPKSIPIFIVKSSS